MKKLFAILLAAVMACLLIPAMAEEGVAGEWYGKVFGGDARLVLTEDGTYIMYMGDSSIDGTYELKDGIVYMDGGSWGFAYDGTSLVNEQFGVTLTRDGSAQGSAFADVNPAAALEDFAGEWICRGVALGDQVVDLRQVPEELIAQLGTIPVMTINGTTVAISESEFLGLADGYTFEMTYGEGSLTMEETNGAVIRVQILEDGMAVLTLSLSGEESSIWFEPAAAAEEPAA